MIESIEMENLTHDQSTEKPKIVYVIGAGRMELAKIKSTLELKGNFEIVCVNSMEEIPFSEQIKSNPTTIRQIHEFKAPPILEMPYERSFEEKRKGHERPYKFHR